MLERDRGLFMVTQGGRRRKPLALSILSQLPPPFCPSVSSSEVLAAVPIYERSHTSLMLVVSFITMRLCIRVFSYELSLVVSSLIPGGP